MENPNSVIMVEKPCPVEEVQQLEDKSVKTSEATSAKTSKILLLVIYFYSPQKNYSH